MTQEQLAEQREMDKEMEQVGMGLQSFMKTYRCIQMTPLGACQLEHSFCLPVVQRRVLCWICLLQLRKAGMATLQNAAAGTNTVQPQPSRNHTSLQAPRVMSKQ